MDFNHLQINTFSCNFPYKNSVATTFWNDCVSARLSILSYRIIFLISLIVSYPSYAEKKSILIITNKSIQRNDQISLFLKKSFLEKKNISAKIFHYQDISRKKIILANASLIITLGSKASKLDLLSSTPILHALIPENNINKISLCASKNCPKFTNYRSKNYSIFLDQPLFRQLNFLSLLLPSAKKIGVVTADFSQPKTDLLRLEAKKLNLDLITRHIENEFELNRQINQLIRDIDVLFTLPDPIIHNRNNIPYLLLSTYRQNIPVIGFSQAYVNAGAFAAIYSSSEQISQHIIELALKILHSPESISSPNFPAKYFSIAINERVAQSLELHYPDKQTIKSKLLQLEK